MKIVEVIHCCTPGGAEIYVKNLLISMHNQNKENEYELWVLHEANELFPDNIDIQNFENKYIEELKSNEICVKFFRRDGNSLQKRIKWYASIRKVYKDSRPDIVHTHLEIVTFNICMALLFESVKIIETIHNEKISHGKLHRYFLNNKLCKIVSIANKVTESINKELRCKNNKVIQIYNGIELDKFECQRTFEEKNEIKMVAIGRLTKQKNHKFLLESFKLLLEKLEIENKQLPILRVYGQGELKEELLNFINENKIKNVKLMGITNEVNEVLKQSDVYIMSSIFEGFSISLIEAMVSGIAVICTDVGGNKEIIGNEAGILVENNNINQMVEALYNSLDRNVRQKLYIKCLERKKMFDIRESAKQHLELYEKIKEKKWLQ